jgi:uncharacterized membrane protein YjdF
MNYKMASDALCIVFSALLFAMTFMAVYEDVRLSYQVATGALCGVFCLVPLILRRLRIVTLPVPFIIMTGVAIFLHGYGVLLAQYDIMSWWDTVTHTISSITVSLCVFYALMAVSVFDDRVNISRRTMPILIMIIMLAFSTYWEVFEYIVDETTGTNMQYSPWDTMRDMLCNTFGALLVSVYAYLYLGSRNRVDFVNNLEVHPRFRRMGTSKE